MLVGMSSVIKKIGRVALWVVTLLAAASIVDAGLGKFQSADGWQHWFVEVWGYPAWFRTFIGVAEIAGGILLVIPRTAPYAAVGLIIIMLGAFWTVTTKPADLSWFDPLFGIFLYSIVLAARWPWRKGNAS